MAGNTATICVTTFRCDWSSGLPLASICEKWTITKDQLVRLRAIWDLPLRLDRKLRHRPPRQRDPTTTEILEATLRIQATWDDATRESRSVSKPTPYSMKVCPMPEGIDLPPEE